MKNEESRPVYYLIALSSLLLVIFDVVVEYTPWLRESLVGYLIVFLILPMSALAAFSLLLIYQSLKFYIEKRSIPLYLVTSLLGSIIVALYVVFRVNIWEAFPPPLPSGSDRRAFNKQAWVDNKPVDVGQIYPRQEMLQDVINALPGKTKQEVIEMLSTYNGVNELNSNTDNDIEYYLGQYRGVNVGDEWLLIWFDDSGLFKKYRILSYPA